MKKKAKRSKAKKYSKKGFGKEGGFYAKLFLWVMILIVAFVLVDGMAQSVQKIRKDSLNQTNQETSLNSADKSSTSINNNSDIVEITNFVAGSTVTVEFANLTKAGFIVIYEENDGELGIVLGESKYLKEGKRTSLIIALSRSTQINDMLFAAILVDDGDGIYEAGVDEKIVNENGEYVGMRFAVGGVGAENPRM